MSKDPITKDVFEAMAERGQRRIASSKAFEHYQLQIREAFMKAGFNVWQYPTMDAPWLLDVYLPNTDKPAFLVRMMKHVGVWTVYVFDYMRDPRSGYPVCEFNALTVGFPNNVVQATLKHLADGLWE